MHFACDRGNWRRRLPCQPGPLALYAECLLPALRGQDHRWQCQDHVWTVEGIWECALSAKSKRGIQGAAAAILTVFAVPLSSSTSTANDKAAVDFAKKQHAGDVLTAPVRRSRPETPSVRDLDKLVKTGAGSKARNK